MSQTVPIRHTGLRSTFASMLIVSYAWAWTASPQGTLAITPLSAAAHDVSIRLSDGHIDLVLLHPGESTRPEEHVLTDRFARDHHHPERGAVEHVVHLCGLEQATIAGSTPPVSGSSPKSSIPTTVRTDPFRAFLATAPGSPPVRSHVLLSRRTTVLLI